jgi:putative solute:sodium symporter small subunit
MTQDRHGDGRTSTEEDGAKGEARTDGGNVDYLESEVSLFSPSTPFMRDHLRMIWKGFTVWAVIVFAPPVLTFVAPDAMSTTMPVIGFPLHYFLMAVGGPTGTLLLSLWYTRRRDALDEKYGIGEGSTETGGTPDGAGEAAADGGGEA